MSHWWGFARLHFGNSSVFLKDLNIGLEGTLSKFGGNTKLEGPVESLDGKEALQADLDKLEGLAITNHMKFNRNKCQTAAFVGQPWFEYSSSCVAHRSTLSGEMLFNKLE